MQRVCVYMCVLCMFKWVRWSDCKQTLNANYTFKPSPAPCPVHRWDFWQNLAKHACVWPREALRLSTERELRKKREVLDPLSFSDTSKDLCSSIILYVCAHIYSWIYIPNSRSGTNCWKIFELINVNVIYVEVMNYAQSWHNLQYWRILMILT